MAKFRVHPKNDDSISMEVDGITRNDAITRALQTNYVLQKYSYTELVADPIRKQKKERDNG